ncbi:MAG TPA: excinuclease ABC subunit UvrB [Oligoflexus sp.]|uniref:excinuclease ABC subunit UvrB n=1 Tax=Oligoflexus sp. TaxID=1971216 RepID=UPI002D2C87C6|nr:excinuclease ABC subunit UvrB [Oligoflexus sp.]HYX39384.1 excinuclease ABC subunit UvrB [Oligoflexus sp.]
MDFHLTEGLVPKGDQPTAIASITEDLRQGHKHNVLLGVTGSGKTFTMANIIKKLGLPTLVMAPNKTLAAQLFTEFRELFPNNAVGFFISYYDYYQPEAYIPGSDTYIAKDALINDDIDKMRHAATQSLFERKDVIIVASVSCIYGLGSPTSYANLVVNVKKGDELARNTFLRSLIDIQYSRNDTALQRGTFRVRGDVVDILPSHQKDQGIRVEFFGDEVEAISIFDVLTGKKLRSHDSLSIYPNSHYVTERDDMRTIVREILHDLGIRLRELKEENKLVEYQRLEQRTMHDVELLEELGFCPGIENYSRYLTGAAPGAPPPTLLDYFPKEFLTIIDESHITVPQVGAMYRGDRARKENLVNYGFRLPSAMDNRPLKFDEFLERTDKIIHVSATPGKFELEQTGGRHAEQIIRPTGLIDPQIEIRPITNQVDDLLSEIKKVTAAGARILITTLTKRMAEDLTSYYRDLGIKVKYLHSDIDSLERSEILRDLRKGTIDVLIGINLLREGLDLPEVQLVAIMDADKEGFLRSRSSLIQTVGRAARNAQGRVIFFADHITQAMRECIDETDRRRRIQVQYNLDHGITPTTIQKEMQQSLREIYGLSSDDHKRPKDSADKLLSEHNVKSVRELEKLIQRKQKEMQKAAAELEFEKAAEIRDTVAALKDTLLVYMDETGSNQ